MNKLDTFGYWEVSQKKYHNKLQSVIDAVPQGWWPHFNFHEEEFSKFNWLVEPTESLTELYCHRAKQLSEKYDSISIEFSGGADSWNVAYSFLRQGLHINELIYRYDHNISGKEDDKSAANCMAEGKYAAYPWYQKFLEIDPTIKWRTYYTTDAMIDGWSKFQLDPLKYNSVHPGYIVKLPGLSADLPVDFNPTKKTALIYGMDKPNLFFEDGKFYLYFPDHTIIIRAVIERVAMGLPVDDVLFYWDPDAVKMLAKQAHMVMHWFKQNPEMLFLINTRAYRNNEIYYPIVNKIIYPEYKELWQSKKAAGSHIMGHEIWFEDHADDTAHGLNWAKSRQNFSNMINTTLQGTEFEHFKHDENGFARLAASWSKMYCIGTLG